ncbi:MAG TPA: hypothetical protein VGX00_02140 [Thermoplasmata archaeon]|nr:hypothetical protein [Thermoplasmata archaeon]
MAQAPYRPTAAIATPLGSGPPSAAPTGQVSHTLVLANGSSLRGDFHARNPSAPAALAFDPVHRLLVVADANSSSISVFRNGSPIANYSVGRSPSAVATDPVSEQAFVANQGSGSVTFVNLSSGISRNFTVGSRPAAIVYDPSRAALWVANSGSSNLSVLASATGKLLRTIPVASGASDIMVEGSTVWVTCAGSHVVDLINATTYRIFSVINVGSQPASVTWDPAVGAALVANLGSANLSEIALAAGSTTPARPVAIALGNSPTEVQYDPSIASVVVLERDAGAFVMVNATTMAIGAPLAAPPGATAFLATGTNAQTFVADTSADVVDLVQLSPLRMLDRFGGGEFYWGAGWLTFDPANARLYAAIWDRAEVAVLNPTGNHVDKVLKTGGTPTGIALDPKANLIIVPGQDDAQVTIINATTNTDVGNVSTGSYTWPMGAAYDPNNHNAYVSDDITNDVYVLNSTSTGFTLSTTIGIIGILTAEWSTGFEAFDPATNRLFVSEMNAARVTVINTVSNSVVANINVGSTPGVPAYDPANGEIYVPNSRSGNISVLDGANGNHLATIRTCGAPLEAMYDATSNHVLVLCNYLTKVVVINTTSNTILENLTSVPGGSLSLTFGNLGIALDPFNQELFTSDSDSSSTAGLNLTEFQLPSSIVTDRLPVGHAPSDAAIVPASGDLLVTDASRDRLDKLAPSATSILASVPAGTRPISVGIDPGRGFAWVANAGGLSKYNLSTLAPLGNTSLPAVSGPLWVDPSMGELFVALPRASSVAVVNESSDQIVQIINVGPRPEGMAFDPTTGDLLVALEGARAVAIVFPGSGVLVGTLPVGDLPTDVAYDPANDLLYVSNSGSANLTILDGSTYRSPGSTPLGADPSGVSYDPANQAIVTTEPGNGSLSYVSSWTGRQAGDATVAVHPGDVVAAANGTLMVLDPSAGSVSVLNSPGLPSIAGLNTTPTTEKTSADEQIAFRGSATPANATTVPVVGYTWSLANASVGSLNTSFGLLVTLTIGAERWANTTLCLNVVIGTLTRTGCSAVHVVPSAGRIGSLTISPGSIVLPPHGTQTFNAVVRAQAGNVLPNATVLWQLSPSSLGALSSGTGSPISLKAGDVDESGLLCAQARFNGSSLTQCVNVTVTSPPPERFPVTFSETGLPPGTLWLVTVRNVTGGTQNSSTLTTIGFRESNGTYTFSVQPAGGAYPNVTSGTVSIRGSPASVSVLFTTAVYRVAFVETGLRAGTTWAASLQSNQNRSTTSTIGFEVPNGSYSWSVGGVVGYQGQGSGSLTVDGANVTIRLAFFQTNYAVAFNEKGLPNGSLWTVSVDGAALSSTHTAIDFTEPNGTHAWSVRPIPGFTTGWQGAVVVAGAGTGVGIDFASVTYGLTFEAAGLTAGASWEVTVGGVTKSSTAGTLVFDEPNGTYSFWIQGPAGLVASTSSGTASVAGPTSPVLITFTAPRPSGGGGPVSPAPAVTFGQELGLAGGAALAAAALGLLLWARGRDRRGGTG